MSSRHQLTATKGPLFHLPIAKLYTSTADPSTLSRPFARTPRLEPRSTLFTPPARRTLSSPRPARRDSDKIASSTPCTACISSSNTMPRLPTARRARVIRTRVEMASRARRRSLPTRDTRRLESPSSRRVTAVTLVSYRQELSSETHIDLPPLAALRLFGFGAVSANGFGIGYIIKVNLLLS